MVDKLREEWYRLNNIDTSNMDNLEKRFHSGFKSGILKAINILAGAEQMSDKGYELSTLEKQQEFAKKRNYDIGDCV